jgi:hypothetical protein
LGDQARASSENAGIGAVIVIVIVIVCVSASSSRSAGKRLTAGAHVDVASVSVAGHAVVETLERRNSRLREEVT